MAHAARIPVVDSRARRHVRAGGVHPGFEGGQNPLIKGLPHLRGFKNPFRVEYQVVNLGATRIAPGGRCRRYPGSAACSRHGAPRQ